MASPNEAAVCNALTATGGYDAVKVGNAQDRPCDFDPELALDTAELFAFIGATQADEWAKVHMSHDGADHAQQPFAKRLADEIDKRGTIDVLRHGIVYAGHEKAEIRLAYFQPASGLKPDLGYRAVVIVTEGPPRRVHRRSRRMEPLLGSLRGRGHPLVPRRDRSVADRRLRSGLSVSARGWTERMEAGGSIEH